MLGLDQAVVARLLRDSKITRGAPYNSQLFEQFFQKNKSLLPADALIKNLSEFIRNDSAGTVSLIFDFRQCPPIPSSMALFQRPN
jgi:hypothetical protein